MKKLLLLISLLLLSIPAWSEKNMGRFQRGLGSMDFTEYAPLADKPITLYYYIPTTGNVKKMPVIITFHGADRSGKGALECWKDFAEADGFIILAPEFPKQYYNENAYQFGNVVVSKFDNTVNPEEIWTYSAIEPIFDYFQSQTGNKVKTYSIQGHSAGGQFTHRYLLAKPNARVDIAVASNPGTWTWLTVDGSINGSSSSYGWPYTIHGTPFESEEYIKSYLAKDLVVHIGDSDTATSGPHISNNEPSLAQGEHRFDRGQKYFKSSRAIADKYKTVFGWDMVIVGGIGHRGKGMVYARSRRDENNNRVYSIKETRPTGAYEIIFGDRY